MRKSTSMRRSTSILLFTAMAITAMLLASTTAQAITTVLSGTNGQVDVGELLVSPGNGEYFLDILGTSIQVFGFAVSINTVTEPDTDRSGWEADFVSQAAWDLGFDINEVEGGLLTTDIGPFSDFFGTDLFANLYYNETGSDIGENSDTDQPFPTVGNGEFTFATGEPGSHFVAFTATGGVISQSLPEPSTIVLLGSGLAGIIAWRMRKGRA